MKLNFGKSLRMLHPEPISIQHILHPLLETKQVQLAVLRLDQIHPQVSGNKFFKLKYNLDEAKTLGQKTLLTFGGAYSNHIFATASAARSAGFQSIGIIRGEDADQYNPTLQHARKMGMQLHFISREQYRTKDDPSFLDGLKSQFGSHYLIPEGGTNELAIQGTKEILSDSTDQFSQICISIGTGGTFAGLAASIKSHQTLIGFSSLKGEFIHQEIFQVLTNYNIQPKGPLDIQSAYHFGGYGKHTPELIRFLIWFYEEFQIPLDPIYTGKMAFGIWSLIERNHFPQGSKILMIHSGGLQGNEGFAKKFGINLPIL